MQEAVSRCACGSVARLRGAARPRDGFRPPTRRRAAEAADPYGQQAAAAMRVAAALPARIRLSSPANRDRSRRVRLGRASKTVSRFRSKLGRCDLRCAPYAFTFAKLAALGLAARTDASPTLMSCLIAFEIWLNAAIDAATDALRAFVAASVPAGACFVASSTNVVTLFAYASKDSSACADNATCASSARSYAPRV